MNSTNPYAPYVNNARNGSAPAAERGVVLLAHGSRSGNHTIDGLREMVSRLQARLDADSAACRAKVVMACLEFIQPDLPAAVGALVDQGCGDITVMPFLLGQGTHTTEDLDEEIARSLAAHPHARISAAESFGADPALADIAASRVMRQPAAALNCPALNGKGSGGAKPTGVLLVKAGTRSPAETHGWLHTLGDMLEERLGDGYPVEVAQSHFGAPTMDAAARELVDRRGAASVTCVPYIFFPGLILTRNIMGGLDTLRQRYPAIPFSLTPTLGVDARLVDLTARRILSAQTPAPIPATANDRNAP